MAAHDLYAQLSAGAQSAYSDVVAMAQHAEVNRSVAMLPGSFQKKQVRGRTYWYYAYRDAFSGKIQQLYIGPDSPQVQALIGTADVPPSTQLGRQVAAAVALGCSGVIPKHFRVIRQLANSQFFRAGGILIGSHAFAAMGNMLGVHWQQATATLDIDFAAETSNIAVGLPPGMDIDVHHAIESLEMGFLPSLNLSGGTSGTYVSEQDEGLRLDFLTPDRGQTGAARAPHLNLSLQPLKFLDYLLEGPVQAALLGRDDAIVVNIPDPVRFAFHKLLVAAERPIAERAKVTKDLTQAAALLGYVQDFGGAGPLEEAWSGLVGRGPGWRKRAEDSMRQLVRLFPDYSILSFFGA